MGVGVGAKGEAKGEAGGGGKLSHKFHQFTMLPCIGVTVYVHKTSNI